MRTFHLEFSENGWEYMGYLYVECNELNLMKMITAPFMLME